MSRYNYVHRATNELAAKACLNIHFDYPLVYLLFLEYNWKQKISRVALNMYHLWVEENDKQPRFFVSQANSSGGVTKKRTTFSFLSDHNRYILSVTRLVFRFKLYWRSLKWTKSDNKVPISLKCLSQRNYIKIGSANIKRPHYSLNITFVKISPHVSLTTVRTNW